MRDPGESYSDVIIRVARGSEKLQPIPKTLCRPSVDSRHRSTSQLRKERTSPDVGTRALGRQSLGHGCPLKPTRRPDLRHAHRLGHSVENHDALAAAAGRKCFLEGRRNSCRCPASCSSPRRRQPDRWRDRSASAGRRRHTLRVAKSGRRSSCRAGTSPCARRTVARLACSAPAKLEIQTLSLPSTAAAQARADRRH